MPKSAVEGKYKAAAIYDPTPYPAGVYEKTLGYLTYPYAEDSFDYNKLLVRGFAVVEACGIGTYGSEGFELCRIALFRR